MSATGGTPAFSLVLHTWTQDLRLHLHLHAVMACGVLGQDGQWHVPTRKPDFLFAVQALSKVFRGKFLATLAAAHKMGQIERDPQGQDDAWRERQRQLYRHDWVVYAKTPLGGPAQVLEYLSRYTHRTAIGNERILALNEAAVVFTVRGDDQGGKRRVTLVPVCSVASVASGVVLCAWWRCTYVPGWTACEESRRLMRFDQPTRRLWTQTPNARS